MGLTQALTAWRPTIVHRNDPVHPPAAFDQDSTRRLVPVEIEEAPRPVPYSLYSGVGRDQEHARPTVWQYQQLAPAEWLTVMGWPFQVAKVPSALVVSMPRGAQNPIRSRTNIDNPTQTALGSLTTLGGVQSYEPALSKITF